MAVDAQDIAKIANLARIRIDDADVPALAQRITAILDLVEQMSAVDTEQVAPLANPLEASQRLRADEISEINQRDAFQSVAPATEAGLYLVPKVIE